MDSPLFKTKAVKIETLGDYLGKIRKQLNFDIKAVSTLAQIKPEYIQKLEQGKYSDLPAEVYIRGFLKNLASVYHIEEQILIDQYEKERGFEPVAKPVKPESRKFSLTPKTIILVTSLVLAVVFLGYVIWQVRSVLTPPYLEITDPVSDITVSGSSFVITGKVEVGAEVMINNQAISNIDKNGQFSESLFLSSGLNIVEIVAKNKFGKTSKITRQINAEVPKTQETAEKLPINVTLEIGPESAWIYLEVDGVVAQKGTMLPGATKTVSGKDDVLLTSANAGSTRVIYNSKDLGKLGREGEVIRNVEFTGIK
jgi:cytoskeletal protein RodZ